VLFQDRIVVVESTDGKVFALLGLEVRQRYWFTSCAYWMAYFDSFRNV